MMEEITIEKTTPGVGFVGKPEVKTLEAVKFKNGKIAYLDGQTIRSFESEAALEDYPLFKIVKPLEGAVG